MKVRGNPGGGWRLIPLRALLAALLGAACASPETSEVTSPKDPTSHLGGCILNEPLGDVPDDLYEVTDVLPTGDYPPFTKKLIARGLTLVAGEDVSDDFLRLVAKTIAETLPHDDGIEVALQEEVLRNHYRYRAVIPVPIGEDFSFAEHAEWPAVESHNSVCDIIMQGVPRGQVMEVIEHILHYVTDIGLHATFPEVWGLSEESLLHSSMETAIENGWYQIGGYDDIEEPDVRQLVLLQEFAYWVISSAWDLQRDYGPDEDEWQLRTPEQLADELPELWAAYQRTAAQVMAAPSRETLSRIGPTRAEER